MIYCTNKTFIKIFRVFDYGKVKVCEGGTSEKLENGSYRKSYWKVILRGEAMKNIPVGSGCTIAATRYKIEATINEKKKEKGPEATIILYEGEVVNNESREENQN